MPWRFLRMDEHFALIRANFVSCEECNESFFFDFLRHPRYFVTHFKACHLKNLLYRFNGFSEEENQKVRFGPRRKKDANTWFSQLKSTEKRMISMQDNKWSEITERECWSCRLCNDGKTDLTHVFEVSEYGRGQAFLHLRQYHEKEYEAFLRTLPETQREAITNLRLQDLQQHPSSRRATALATSTRAPEQRMAEAQRSRIRRQRASAEDRQVEAMRSKRRRANMTPVQRQADYERRKRRKKRMEECERSKKRREEASEEMRRREVIRSRERRRNATEEQRQREAMRSKRRRENATEEQKEKERVRCRRRYELKKQQKQLEAQARHEMAIERRQQQHQGQLGLMLDNSSETDRESGRQQGGSMENEPLRENETNDVEDASSIARRTQAQPLEGMPFDQPAASLSIELSDMATVVPDTSSLSSSRIPAYRSSEISQPALSLAGSDLPLVSVGNGLDTQYFTPSYSPNTLPAPERLSTPVSLATAVQYPPCLNPRGSMEMLVMRNLTALSGVSDGSSLLFPPTGGPTSGIISSSQMGTPGVIPTTSLSNSDPSFNRESMVTSPQLHNGVTLADVNGLPQSEVFAPHLMYSRGIIPIGSTPSVSSLSFLAPGMTCINPIGQLGGANPSGDVSSSVPSHGLRGLPTSIPTLPNSDLMPSDGSTCSPQTTRTPFADRNGSAMQQIAQISSRSDRFE